MVFAEKFISLKKFKSNNKNEEIFNSQREYKKIIYPTATSDVIENIELETIYN